MRRFIALPLLALAACAASDGASVAAPERDFVTQIDVPAPDYPALIAAGRPDPDAEIVRESAARPPANARAIGALWVERLEERGWLDSYGLGGKEEDAPVSSIDTRLTAQEFEAWLAENDWHAPEHIRWRFAAPLIAPRVSEAAAPGIRLWPASEQRTGLQLQAAAVGQIFLRDGCFFVRNRLGGGSEQLAWFHTETGLDVDAQGYHVLVNRMDGQLMGRLGEVFTWAAPNPILPGGPDPAELIAACGDYPIVSVGNPQTEERLFTVYPQSRQPPDAAPPPDVQ